MIDYLLDCFLECFYQVQFFPCEFFFTAAKVTVCCGLAINRTAQIEPFDDTARREINFLHHKIRELCIRNDAGAEGLDLNGHRIYHTDRICYLDLTFVASFAATIFFAR